MAKKKKQQPVENNLGFDSVEQTLTKTEQFLEKNARKLGLAIGGTVLLILLYLMFTSSSENNESGNEMAASIKWFEIDSMDIALNGINGEYGLLDIISEYDGTPAGNSAHYYAGLAYYQLGEYEEAIEYLDEYEASNVFTAALAKGVIGDAFVELGQMEDALDYYVEAYEADENDFTTPLYLWKAGLVYESLGQNANAVTVYERIEADYPESRQAQSIVGVIPALK